MSERTDPSNPEPRLTRALVAFTAWAARHPWPVLAVCALTLAASVYLSYSRLQYRTQRDDLMAADKACQVRWRHFVAEFGADDDIVFVVEGGDRAALEAAVEHLAAKLRADPDHFDRVFHQVDLRPLRGRALLYLTEAELRALDGRLDALGPLLGPAAPAAWRGFTLDNLVLKVRAELAAAAPDRAALDRLAAVFDSAAKTLRDPAAYASPWGPVAPPGGRDHLDRPRYFFNDDGTLAFLLARPAGLDRQSFTPAAASVARARAIVAAAGAKFPGLAFGLTGLPVLEHDEMADTDRDSLRASLLALAAVAVLYLAAYRGLRYPLLTVVTLVAGTVWALGLTTLAVGHLNILSSAFAVMLIGMGDFGVLWVARFDEERRAGHDVREALTRTAAQAGPGILTAAVTTSLAFFAAMLADFQAVAELGFIAGSGVLLCALACFVLMPALQALAPGRHPAVAGFVGPAPGSRTWLPGALLHPRLVLGAAAVLFVAGLVFAARLKYDHNLLHMQSPDLESVRWEKKVVAGTAGAGWQALSIADTPEQALALREQYERLAEVGRVEEVASLVPRDQDRKLPLVGRIASRLRHLPGDDAAPPAPDVGALRRDVDLAIAEPDRRPGGEKLRAALRSLREALADAPAGRVADVERRLAADLRAGLGQLRGLATAAPITVDDLPAALRERFVGVTGKWLVRAYARDDVWEYDALSRFVRKVRSVDPAATGKPFGTLEGLRAMKRGFQRAGIYSLLAIVAVLLLDLRSGRCVLFALLPFALGVGVALGLLSVFGVPLNPANLIALPLIVGVGVDHGVHVLHDYRSRAPGTPFRLSAATGRGILVAALTTMLGFGAMMISRHPGMRGLGLTLTVGVGCCVMASLVVLPVVLRVLDRRKPPGAAEAVRKAA